ncbi:MAG: integrase family protein [Betaproteobacteria bacterium]
MARPKKSDTPDLAQRCNLSAGAIERLICPLEKPQAFLRDTEAPSLRVRVTPAGAKSFVFEAKLNRQTIRRTIGDVREWSIEQARTEARRLAVLVDNGTDPRELDRQREAAQAAAAAQAAEQAAAAMSAAVPARMTWERYVQERRPHWRERTYTDHLKVAQAGGREKVRGKGLTQPGPLAPLLVLPLAELTPAAVDAWAAREAKDRPARVRLALRMLKAFLRWAAAEPDLADRVNTAAASSKKAREAAGRSRAKDDVLLKEQLQAWFAQVRALPSRSVCAYLQCLLLLGCRREELLRLRWDDVNWQWKGLRLADKVEDTGREVPLTPYVATLLAGLPRINEWVFASGRPVSLQPQHVERRARYASRTGIQPEPLAQASASGRIADPSSAHRRACAAAGIEGLTLHGLRRSFKSLTEWLEVPVGVVAQIQGHKPSATVEKHYARRPLDLLRVHHERIERWVLEQAGVKFDAKAAKAAPGLREVSAA